MKNVQIGQFGGNSIALPIHSFGKGRPITWVITGIHGNEVSGLLVMSHLIQFIKARPQKLQGTLNILSVANPLAQITNSRCHPIDQNDLNRSFPGKLNQGPTLHVAATLLSLLRSADRVVDIHNFTLDSPVTGLLITSNNHVISTQAKHWLLRLPIDCLWMINPSQDNQQKYSGSLGHALNQIDVVNIVIELPPPDHLSLDTARTIAIEIARSVSFPFSTKRALRNSANVVPIIDRKKVFTLTSGIFVPCEKPLMGKIKLGETLGHIIDLRSIAKKPVKSLWSGVLHGLKPMSSVHQGELVAAIG